MSLFEYVSVMVSVILALGIAQILKGIGSLLIAAERPRVYWVHAVWLAFFTILHIYAWWYFWDLRSQPPATAPAFILAVVGPALIYLSTYVLLDGGFPTDARAHFYRVRRPFFCLIIAGNIVPILNPWVMGYTTPASFKVGAAVAAGAGVIGLVTENERFHAAFAVFGLLSIMWAFVVRFDVGAFTPG